MAKKIDAYWSNGPRLYKNKTLIHTYSQDINQIIVDKFDTLWVVSGTNLYKNNSSIRYKPTIAMMIRGTVHINSKGQPVHFGSVKYHVYVDSIWSKSSDTPYFDITPDDVVHVPALFSGKMVVALSDNTVISPRAVRDTLIQGTPGDKDFYIVSSGNLYKVPKSTLVSSNFDLRRPEASFQVLGGNLLNDVWVDFDSNYYTISPLSIKRNRNEYLIENLPEQPEVFCISGAYGSRTGIWTQPKSLGSLTIEGKKVKSVSIAGKPVKTLTIKGKVYTL